MPEAIIIIPELSDDVSLAESDAPKESPFILKRWHMGPPGSRAELQPIDGTAQGDNVFSQTQSAVCQECSSPPSVDVIYPFIFFFNIFICSRMGLGFWPTGQFLE